MQLFKLLPFIALLSLLSIGAYAADPRCNAPPYGGTVAKYKSFVATVGTLLDSPAMTLSAICNTKFSDGDRRGLYNLGITDAEIESNDVEDIAVQMVIVLKNLADHIK